MMSSGLGREGILFFLHFCDWDDEFLSNWSRMGNQIKLIPSSNAKWTNERHVMEV